MTVKLGYPDPELSDGVVTLRPWSTGDLACIEEASLDPYIPEGTTVPRMYSRQQGLKFIERQHGRVAAGKGVTLAVAETVSGEAVGHINLLRRPQQGVAGIGYWLIKRKRGNHLGLRAVRLLNYWALRETSLERIEALVEPTNRASVRVLEHAGFQREGLLRSYLSFGARRADVLIYSLLRSDLEAN